MSGDRNFTFSLKGDCWSQLVNNEYMADVIFKVGKTRELIYAHKLILTTASEVFFDQFSGNLAESAKEKKGVGKKPIVIRDIEPLVFLEVMNFIYRRKITLMVSNMLEVYYAAQKYLMHDLISVCEAFFTKRIDETNVLSILNKNKLHKFDVVDKQCLALIRDNPLKFFRQAEFYDLNQRSMELIASSRTMNCHQEDLEDMIEEWKRATGSRECDIVPKLKDIQCRKLVAYSTFHYLPPSMDTDLTITVQKKLTLYGLGIFVGAKDAEFEESIRFNITVEGENTVSVTKDLPLKDQLYTQEIFFEKVAIKQEGCIKVRASGTMYTKLFCLEEFKPVDELEAAKLTISQEGPSFIAYLLYKIKW